MSSPNGNHPYATPAPGLVAAARAGEVGLYQPGKSLRLFPFELRFLARSHTTPSGAVRRSPPDRWVINLATLRNPT